MTDPTITHPWHPTTPDAAAVLARHSTGRPARDPGDGHACVYGPRDVLGVRACVLCATVDPDEAWQRVADAVDMAGAPARLAARSEPRTDDLGRLLARVKREAEA